jgi:hypothetical protein
VEVRQPSAGQIQAPVRFTGIGKHLAEPPATSEWTSGFLKRAGAVSALALICEAPTAISALQDSKFLMEPLPRDETVSQVFPF